ncbi:MAG: hypothetical protein U0271_26360 [Polyangiaceae bacterium]
MTEPLELVGLVRLKRGRRAGRGHDLARGGARAARRERARRRRTDLVRREGLGQIVRRAALHREDGRLERRVRGHDDDASVRLLPQDVAEQIQTRHAPEPKIEENNVESSARERVERGGPAADTEHPRARGLETEAQRLAHPRVVIDDEA